MRSFQGLGEKGGKGIYFRRTGEQRPNFEGNKETKTILGTGNIRKQILDMYGEQGNKGTCTPCEDLSNRNQILAIV